MKRLALMLTAVVAWSFAWTGLAGPELVVEPETCDLGRQSENAGKYEFLFTLKNEGDETLVIEEVRPHCGCTAAELSTDRLVPGESVPLQATLSTKGYEGLVNKSISIDTNDPESPHKRVRVKVRVPFMQSGLRLWPKYTRFPARPYKEFYRVYLWVQNCDEPGKKATIESVDLPEGWTLRTELPLTVAGEQKVNLQFLRPFEDGSGFPEADFSVRTDHPETAVLESTIRGEEPLAEKKKKKEEAE